MNNIIRELYRIILLAKGSWVMEMALLKIKTHAIESWKYSLTPQKPTLEENRRKRTMAHLG